MLNMQDVTMHSTPLLHFSDIELSYCFQPKVVACSERLGLVAVYGDAKERNAVLIAATGQPSRQVLVRLAKEEYNQSINSVSWSPASTEDMLMLAFDSGAVSVLSMSSSERYAPKKSKRLPVACSECASCFPAEN